MLEIHDIQQAVRATALKYGLTKVTLFGSFARGEAHRRAAGNHVGQGQRGGR